VAKAKAILRRRRVVTNTRKITRTMELVSTAKYRQSYLRVENAKPFRETMREMMNDLSRADVPFDHPLLRKREPPRHVTLLLLTSNRGLCGGFNTNLARTARDWVEGHRRGGAQVDLHVSGKKGIAFFRFRGVPMQGAYAQFGDRPSRAEVDRLAQTFLAAYESAATDLVAVCYQRFFSAGVQRPWIEVLLPVTPGAVESGAAAAPGAPAAPAVPTAPVEYLFSPDAETLLGRLLPGYFRATLYQAFLESVVGEHRARMVAMKNATDNAHEMIKLLTRMYNRARQTQITNEISEIMGGVEALK
jgi:F-type H+-transporting ATPase subunit gamma